MTTEPMKQPDPPKPATAKQSPTPSPSASSKPIIQTRAQFEKDSFNHILDNVLDSPDGSPLKEALKKACVTKIGALNTLKDNFIEQLTYDKSANDKDLPLPDGDKVLTIIHIAVPDMNEALVTIRKG